MASFTVVFAYLFTFVFITYSSASSEQPPISVSTIDDIIQNSNKIIFSNNNPNKKSSLRNYISIPSNPSTLYRADVVTINGKERIPHSINVKTDGIYTVATELGDNQVIFAQGEGHDIITDGHDNFIDIASDNTHQAGSVNDIIVPPLSRMELIRQNTEAGCGPNDTARYLKVYITADAAFCTFFGGGTLSEQRALFYIAETDAAFAQISCLRFRLSSYAVNCDVETDPYTTEVAGLVGSEILWKFRELKNMSSPDGISLLLTGIDDGTSTLGVAFVGVACRTDYAFGWVEGRYIGAHVMTHEIGHLVGLSHASDGIMTPYLNGRDAIVFNNESESALLEWMLSPFSSCATSVVNEQSPVPSATPTAIVSLTVSISPTASVLPTSSATPIPSVVPSPTASSNPTLTASVTPSSTISVTPTSTSSATPTSTSSATPTSTSSATPTSTASLTPSSSTMPTTTSMSTPSAIPTTTSSVPSESSSYFPKPTGGPDMCIDVGEDMLKPGCTRQETLGNMEVFATGLPELNAPVSVKQTCDSKVIISISAKLRKLYRLESFSVALSFSDISITEYSVAKYGGPKSSALFSFGDLSIPESGFGKCCGEGANLYLKVKAVFGYKVPVQRVKSRDWEWSDDKMEVTEDFLYEVKCQDVRMNKCTNRTCRSDVAGLVFKGM